MGVRAVRSNVAAGDRLPDATSSVEQGLRDLAAHGVAIHQDFISADMADRLHERMAEQAFMERQRGVGRIGGPDGLSATPTHEVQGALRTSEVGETEEPIYQVLLSLVNKGAVFRDLMMNPTAHAYAEGVLGPHPWVLWGHNGIITRRGAREQFLHIDSSTLPAEMLTRATSINCFICVTDFDLDMGPTSFVPGSHLGPRLRYDGDERTERFPAIAKKGSAIIWDGRTWHGQGGHDSDQPRYAIAMSYCLYAIRQGENFAASVQDEVLETLSDDQKRVLGFETTMVGAMNGFGPRNATDKHHGLGYSPHYVPEMRR